MWRVTSCDVVPPGLEAKAREGAFKCPEGAIYVGEAPPPK